MAKAKKKAIVTETRFTLNREPIRVGLMGRVWTALRWQGFFWR